MSENGETAMDLQFFLKYWPEQLIVVLILYYFRHFDME